MDTTVLSEYPKIVKRMKLSANDFKPFSTWIEQGYTRNCLARTEAYELILLCWDVGAKAPIHGHGGKDCWFFQIQGTVEEVRFQEDTETLTETNRIVLVPGKIDLYE